MLYISVANRLSVDCDCDGNPHEPEMADLGIFASTDPVALDQACYDAVINADDPGKEALIRRMEEKHGILCSVNRLFYTVFSTCSNVFILARVNNGSVFN